MEIIVRKLSFIPLPAYAGTLCRRSGRTRRWAHSEAAPLPPERPAAVEVEGLRVHYASQEAPVLTISHLSVPVGERLALTGANGAGKSTLLKSLAGLIRPDAGQVRIFGEKPDHARGYMAYLPQLRAIDWHYPISVEDFALLGASVRLGWFRRPGKTWKQREDALLERLQLYPLKQRPIRALSGGEQQRLLLARALLPDPDLYLLDEPLTAVDAHSVEVIGSILQEEHAAGKTMVVATHHLDFGRSFRFDRQLRVHCGCVHAVQSDPEALHEEPVSPPLPEPLVFRPQMGAKATAATTANGVKRASTPNTPDSADGVAATGRISRSEEPRNGGDK